MKPTFRFQNIVCKPPVICLYKKHLALVFFSLYFLFSTESLCAQSKFVQWAENPLGFYPVGLEGGTGFAWGVSAIGATFLLGEIFSKKDTLTKYRFSVFDEPG